MATKKSHDLFEFIGLDDGGHFSYV